jgi:DNA end-binding protein Ku
MPRSLWRGSLSFGLVNVPVALVSAVRDLDVHFHQLHASTHARLEVRRVCSKEGGEVPYEEIANAFDLDDGNQVVLTDDELAAAQPEKTRTIDISEFVDLEEIDPAYFVSSYFLVPDDQGEGPARAYRLLVEAMEGSGRAALGQFVLRTREHLVALRVRDGLLQLTTMVFADELRPVDDLAPGDDAAPSADELRNAVALVEELSGDFRPQDFPDRHRERLEHLIARKRKGETVKAPAEPETPKAVPDLLKALEQSLADVRGTRERRGDHKGSGSARKRPARR